MFQKWFRNVSETVQKWFRNVSEMVQKCFRNGSKTVQSLTKWTVWTVINWQNLYFNVLDVNYLSVI
jgi:hypothetical protein